MAENKDMQMARRIAELAAEKGGTAYFVGGFVRDQLRGYAGKDIDIEVYGLKPAELEEILDTLGQRLSMGESFGVFGLKGYDLDIAMPRKEKLRGTGHRDFDVTVDPFIGTEKAALRRDFTINAMMQNILTGEIVDHFGGQDDLKAGIIRHVSDETFAEDPLRVLRGAQFAARFEYSIADDTVSLCKQMDLSTLASERIMGELEKALLKAARPSIFFEELRRMEQLTVWFPELEQLIGVEQNPDYHLEGDVWTHTMMVLDAAAAYRADVKDPVSFMMAAVTHDLGKAICTEVVDGRIRSIGHETIGLPLAEAFVKRITAENDLLKNVLNLTQLHMKPNVCAASGSAVKSTNKMFDSAIDPKALMYIAFADERGRIAVTANEGNEEFLQERLAVYEEYMSRPYVMGRDLILAGLKPGPNFGELLAHAHKLRLAGIPKEEALKQTLGYARQKKG